MHRKLSSFAAFLALAASTAHAQTKVWTSSADFDTGSQVDVSHAMADQLTLIPPPSLSIPVLWADNYIIGTVIKIDTRTGKQLGRYDAALQTSSGVATGVPVPREGCDFATTGNCPGRAVVDLQGNAFFVNRAFAQQGSITKYAGSISRCVDRNGNGKIDTSADANNDGIIDIDDPKEFFGQNDECILWTTPIGKPGELPRAVAVDHNNQVWTATFNPPQVVYQLDNQTGKVLYDTKSAGLKVSSGAPYSMAIGGKYLFISDNSPAGKMQRIDVDLLADGGTVKCPAGNYGIAATPDGRYGLYGRWTDVTTSSLMVVDFMTNTCTASAGGSNNQARGVAIDEQGNIWASQYTGTYSLKKYDSKFIFQGEYPLSGGAGMGVAVDIDGNILSVSTDPNHVDKFNPTTGKILATYNITGTAANISKWTGAYNPAPSGKNLGNPFTPYVYSDMTGKQAAKLANYTHDGAFDAIYDGLNLKLPWMKLTWNTEAQGMTQPANTSLIAAVRASDTLQGLAMAAFTTTTNGAALTGIAGRYVEVRIVFGSKDGVNTPILSDVSIQSICPMGVGDTCCLASPDCDDKNACTADACPGSAKACTHTAIAGCCNANADCDEKNPCTMDVCSGKGGSCGHPQIAGCCQKNSDCNMGSMCMSNVCVLPPDMTVMADLTPAPADLTVAPSDLTSAPAADLTAPPTGDGSVTPTDDSGTTTTGDLGTTPTDDSAVARADLTATTSASDGAVVSGLEIGTPMPPSGGCGCDLGARQTPGHGAPALATTLFLAAWLSLRRRRSIPRR